MVHFSILDYKGSQVLKLSNVYLAYRWSLTNKITLLISEMEEARTFRLQWLLFGLWVSVSFLTQESKALKSLSSQWAELSITKLEHLIEVWGVYKIFWLFWIWIICSNGHHWK